MTSSVSSERAFSLAGITISKRQNHLKADIVEALQCMKCLAHKNLLFREDTGFMDGIMPMATGDTQDYNDGLEDLAGDGLGLLGNVGSDNSEDNNSEDNKDNVFVPFMDL